MLTQGDSRPRAELLKEIQDLRARHDELETLLIECKRAMDANTEMKSLYEVAQDLIELKRAQEALKQERDYFKNVLDNSADAIGIVDARGRFRRWNKRAEELFGYSFEELNGRSAFELYARQDELEVMLSELRRQGYVRDYEISIRTKEGHILPFGMSISKLTEKGKTIGSVCVARDLTQIKQAEAALRRSKEAAEAANKAKSEFLANMSHEIRTPMNAILGFSEALLHKTSDHRHQQYLRTISSSGQTLLALIDDILDLSKIEAGRLEVRPEPQNLRRLIKDVHLVFKPELDRKGLDFILVLDQELPRWLLLDEIRIRQILMNLVGNAVKFTRSGFVRLAVHSVHQGEAVGQTVDLFLEVEDSGIGIPASQQELIFENFRQQDNQRTREFGGTGLGLAITRKLVELMQGTITLESEEGRGALFRVRLPGVAVAQGDSAVSGATEQGDDDLLESQMVPVVDDQEDNIDQGHSSGPFCPLDADRFVRDRLSSEVQEALDQALVPKLTELQETLVMDEVENLALEMEQLAMRCDLPVLLDWSSRLNDFVQNYDVSGVKSMLAHVARHFQPA
jgi:PAS domain S-box-containing protein